jgi:hypothetical protein
MDISSLIAQHIIDVFEGDNWTEVNVIYTLADLNHVEASQKTQASVNTIAGLVHHLRFWNDVMAQRIRGQHIDIPDANGFDNSPLADAESWKTLVESCLASGRRLAEAVAAVEVSRLQQPILTGLPTAYKSLQGSVEHVHYHLGQIVILKQLIRAQNSNV